MAKAQVANTNKAPTPIEAGPTTSEDDDEDMDMEASGGGGASGPKPEDATANVNTKNFRNHPDMENFFRFIYENDLRLEALEIIDQMLLAREAKKKKLELN